MNPLEVRNQLELDAWEDHPWERVIRRTHEQLNKDWVVPGYQIAQIKEKFGGLRYYISQGDCPTEKWLGNHAHAEQIIAYAEGVVDGMEGLWR